MTIKLTSDSGGLVAVENISSIDEVTRIGTPDGVFYVTESAAEVVDAVHRNKVGL